MALRPIVQDALENRGRDPIGPAMEIRLMNPPAAIFLKNGAKNVARPAAKAVE
jgi:hypothetical protein